VPQVRLIAYVVLLLLCGGVSAHPVKPNLSIQATTIAIVTVQDDVVRLELEIGEADQPVFADLVKDGAKATPTEAQQRFCTRGFTIETDEALEGVVKKIVQRKRTERDPVTGEPLTKPSGIGGSVLAVVVEYPLTGKPTRLRLKPPDAKTSIGLVVYHRTIPVNDFDFLTLRETVALDWADPWKSKFTGLQFTRYYSAPVWATLTVEPRAVRLEIMSRPNQPPVSGQVRTSEEIIERFQTAMTMQVDSQFLKPRIEPKRVFRQGLASYKEETQPVPDEARFDCHTLVYPTVRQASVIEMMWPSLPPTLAEIPLWINTATTPVKLTDKNRTHTWTSQTKPGDAWYDSSTEPGIFKHRLVMFSVTCGLIALGWVLPGFRPFKSLTARLLTIPALLALAYLSWAAYSNELFPVRQPLSDEDTSRVLRRLLDQAYRAHEAPDEETTYDALADVVSGPLLRDAYLSMKQVFDSDQAGRTRIRDVSINSAKVIGLRDSGRHHIHVVWTVDVAVIHWGHTHLRSNQYNGEAFIEPKDGQWMLTLLYITDEKQLP
jgi:hypothetical protein